MLVDRGLLRPGAIPYNDFKYVGKGLVGQPRYATRKNFYLNDSGWMYISDAKKINPLLTPGGVMQLIAEQPPDEEKKDRFL
eukprot:2994953-Prorocentrum_lima.AAC.1